MGERGPSSMPILKDSTKKQENVVSDNKMKVCIPDEKARLINGRNKIDLKPEDLEVCDKDAAKLLEDYFGK